MWYYYLGLILAAASVLTLAVIKWIDYHQHNIRKKAVGPLIAALKDEDKVVRQAAAETLGDIGGLRAIEPLIAALKDKDRDVRQAAARALKE